MTQPQEHIPLSYSQGASRKQVRTGETSLVLRLTGPFVWIPAALFAMGCAGGLAFSGLFYLGPVLAPAIAYLGVSFIEMILRSFRERRARVVLSYIDHAVRMNLPLPAFLSAAERSERWTTRRRLAAIRNYVSSGTTLGVALEEGLPELPARWAAIIFAGERNGNLREALARLVEDDVRTRESAPVELGFMRRGYLMALVFAAVTIIAGVMIFVIPKFREIFKDFKATLPQMTENLLAISDWFANDWGWVLFVPPAIILLVLLLARIIRKAFMPGWPALIPTSVFHWILWYVPLAHGMLRDRAMADICQVLADGLRQGRPLVDAVMTAESLEMAGPMRQHLIRWRTELAAGQDPATGAAVAGMPVLAVQFLAGLQTGHGVSPAGEEARPELMEFLANHYGSRFSRTAVVIRATFEPILVVLMALVVGYIVVALFLPLAKLIQSVVGFPGDII